MSEELPSDIVDLAEEYLESLDEVEGYEGDPEEAREDLEYWEEQVDEFEEGTPMHEMAVEERDKRRERLEAFDARGERRNSLRTELLTRATTEFAPQGDWLETTVIKALSHAFHGQQHECLFVGEFCLPDDQDDMTKRDMVNAAKTVHTLARDVFDDVEQVAEVWDALDTTARLPIAKALAKHRDPLTSGEISDEIGEGGPADPGSNIRELRGKLDIEPFYGSNRGYTLTLAGRHAMVKYAPEIPESEVETDTLADAEESETVVSSATEEAPQDDTDDEQKETRKEVDLSSFDVRE